MGKSGELLKNTAIISIGKMGTQVVNFLLLPLYTAKLSTADYGNFDYVTTIASFLVPLMTMLMEESMFRFLIDSKTDEEKKIIISHTFLFCLVSGFVTSLLIGAASWLFNYSLGYAILIYCISSLLIALSNALARGTEHIGLYSLSNFFVSVTIILLNLLLILGFHQGFYALMASACIANTVAACFVLTKLKFWSYIDIKNYRSSIIRKMLAYSVPLVPNTISWSVINASDRLVIMNFLGASANGLYSIAYKFPNLISTFYNFFNIAWRETSAKIVRDNDIKEFYKIYKMVKAGIFAITVILIATIRYIYPLFINIQYQESIVYVPILAISTYYTSLSAFYGGVFSAYKETKILGTTSTYAAIINLVVDLALFKAIGVYAAAISTLASSLFLYLYRKYRMKKFFDANGKDDAGILAVFIILFVLFYWNNQVLNLAAVILALVVSAFFNFHTASLFLHKLKGILIRYEK